MTLFLTFLSFLILIGALLFMVAAVIRPFGSKPVFLVAGSTLMTTGVVLLPLFLHIGKTLTPTAQITPEIGAGLFASPGIAATQVLLGVLLSFLSLKKPGSFRFAFPQDNNERRLFFSSLVVMSEGLISGGMIFLVGLLLRNV